jgi:hypothetical protein
MLLSLVISMLLSLVIFSDQLDISVYYTILSSSKYQLFVCLFGLLSAVRFHINRHFQIKITFNTSLHLLKAISIFAILVLEKIEK